MCVCNMTFPDLLKHILSISSVQIRKSPCIKDNGNKTSANFKKCILILFKMDKLRIICSIPERKAHSVQYGNLCTPKELKHYSTEG